MITYLLLPVMLVSFAFYIYSLYRCRVRTRVISKAVTSAVFVAIALLSCWAGGANLRYFVYILIALVLCTFGDVFLEISHSDELGINYFIYALFAFFAAHVAFLLLFCSIAGITLVDIVLTAAIVGVLVLLSKLCRLTYFNMGGYVFFYAVVMSLMFVKSLSLLYVPQYFGARNILVACGASLFLISNLAYAFISFRKVTSKWMYALTSAVYYTGQTLISLSVLFAR